jgi:hypothetical protein
MDKNGVLMDFSTKNGVLMDKKWRFNPRFHLHEWIDHPHAFRLLQ